MAEKTVSLTKDDIADALESMAQLLDLKGENPFKIRAYQNAARAIQQFSGALASLDCIERIEEIPGIGKSIAEKIHELLTTGRLRAYEELKTKFPPGLFELFELQGLGAKKIKAVYEKLGVDTIESLQKACNDGRVAGLAGFGEKTARNICAAIEARAKYAGTFRFGDIAAGAEHLLEELRGHPAVIQCAIGGSYRRRKETVHDLDFLVSTKTPERVTEFFVRHPSVERVIAQGPTRSSVRLKSGIQADLRVVKDSEYPFALLYFTGSKEHNVRIRARALERGWTLNEYRIEEVAKVEGRRAKAPARPIPKIHTEAEIYRALDLDFIEPELREDRGEIAAAEKNALPRLIELENLRGTFHCHTTASDGRSSLEEMARAAQELGLQYLGIADHSKSSFQAHGLSAEQLLEQVKTIRAMNESFEGFRLFAGTECDILKDGSLDFPDEILAQLDYVVASVHAVFNLPEKDMTARILRAIENPHVTMLGHLTGRLLLEREGYAVNVPAIIDACAASGTIIELNANPYRLDMDWRWWPLAKEKGVRCAINPDAHHTSNFQYLAFGIGTARKGWLTRDEVVNTLPLGKIERALAAKRNRRLDGAARAR